MSTAVAMKVSSCVLLVLPLLGFSMLLGVSQFSVRPDAKPAFLHHSRPVDRLPAGNRPKELETILFNRPVGKQNSPEVAEEVWKKEKKVSAAKKNRIEQGKYNLIAKSLTKSLQWRLQAKFKKLNKTVGVRQYSYGGAKIEESVIWDEKTQKLAREALDELSIDFNPLNNPPDNINIADSDLAREKFEIREYGQTLRTLVVFSSYRIASNRFAVVALSPAVLKAAGNILDGSCAWASSGDSSEAPDISKLRLHSQSHAYSAGNATILYANDNHDRAYAVVVITCSFQQAVGSNGNGGFLYLNVSSGFEEWEAVPVFREGLQQSSSMDYEAPSFAYEYAYCSAPIWNNVNPEYLIQWLLYHSALWGRSVHFFIYDTVGIDREFANEIAEALRPFVDGGHVTVINMEEQKQHEMWYHSQHIAINDCLYRSRFLAKWVFSFDFDQYLHVNPNLGMSKLLEERANLSWVSFGTVLYNRAYCLADEGDSHRWAVQRMVFRCGQAQVKMNRTAKCHEEEVMRKWVANPRKVNVAGIHALLDFASEGEVLDTSIARLNHYSGLLGKKTENCVVIMSPESYNASTALQGWWLADMELANTAGSYHYRRDAKIVPKNVS